MCCCKPELIHDESLKYQLLYSEEVEIHDDVIQESSYPISAEQAKMIEKKINTIDKDQDFPDEIALDDLEEYV